MTDDVEELKNRIWLTSKARKYAESKCIQRNISLHFLTFISTVAVIGFSVFQQDFCDPAYAQKAIITVSVFLLAISIFLFGQKFGERAAQYRECYLKLDQLRDENSAFGDLSTKYANILQAYPNHSESDFDSFVFAEVVLNKGKVTGATGEELKATTKRGLAFFGNLAFVWLIPIGTIFALYVAWTSMQC